MAETDKHPYLLPFEAIRRRLEVRSERGELKVTLGYDTLLAIIRQFLAFVPVDEAWYCAQYPDIAEAIAAGQVEGVRQHFTDNGYFEGRLPFPLAVDEAWYLAENADVAAAIAGGEIASANEHFQANGYREGRLPFPAPAPLAEAGGLGG